MNQPADFNAADGSAATKNDDNFTKAGIDDDIKKQADGEEEIDNTLPAGDEFLIWEPRNFFEKIKNFLFNTMEANIVIIVAMVAYCHPSTNSLGYFLAYLALFYPMSKDIKDRYGWNMIICIVLLLMEMVTIFFKRKEQKLFNGTQEFKKADYKTYHEKVTRLLLWGFTFEYDPYILEPEDQWGQIKKASISGMNFVSSYDTEIAAFVSNIFLIIFSYL